MTAIDEFERVELNGEVVDRINRGHYWEWVCEQQTDTWWNIKKGIPSASNFDRIITPVKGEPSAQAEEYAAELVGELFSRIPPEGVENFTNRSMRWGNQGEEEARNWYQMQTGLEVRRVGWLTSADHTFGCSPDAMVGSIGGLELKCPQHKQAMIYFLKPAKLLKDYRCQVHGALVVTQFSWWDLVSYHPGIPPVKIHVEWDEFTQKLQSAIRNFIPSVARIKAIIEGKT